VVDVDPRNGGAETLQRLQADLGPLPPAPIVKTGGGGWHLYFAWPEGGVRGKCGGNGIDIKGAGGLVVAPPSVHQSGARYTWEIPPDGKPLPCLPASWLRWLGGDCYTDHSPTQDGQSSTLVTQATKTTHDTTDTTDNAGHYSRGSQTCVCDQPSNGQFIDDCIQGSLPDRPGQRHASVFKLARLLRGNTEVAVWPPKKLRGVVNRWYKLLAEKLGSSGIRADADENWVDFWEGWDKVRCPGETGIMTAILERAKAADLPKVALDYQTDRTRLLIKVCRELQREVGDKPFFLATSTVQSLLGFEDRMAASRMLRGLCVDGVLRLVERGGPKGRQASSFRYLGD